MQIYLQFFRKGSPKSYARMGRAEALVARWFNRGPQRRLRLFARMGRGGAMERFISACRNPLAKSATTNSYLIRLRCHGLRRSRSSGTKCRKENLWQSDIDSPKIQKKIRFRIKSECKGTAFFWHGNGLVRIACGIGPDCVHVPPWLGKMQEKK